VNKYHCFYAGKECIVEAETTLRAQEEAASIFRAKKRYDVAVVLIEKDGEPVSFDPNSLPGS
jgi:hypothetical protein